MRPTPVITCALLLASCTASIVPGRTGSGAALIPALLRETQPSGPEASIVYAGKFATNSAVNSERAFLGEYYGDLWIAVYPSGKMECTFITEGKMPNLTSLQSASTVCIGRVQEDATFSFRGAYVMGSRPAKDEVVSPENILTFTLEGVLRKGEARGRLLLGNNFVTTMPGEDQGAAFVIYPRD